MEINLSSLNFTQMKSKDKEFDYVEHGIYRGTDSAFEFIVMNWQEVFKRLGKLCDHMNKYDHHVKDQVETIEASIETNKQEMILNPKLRRRIMKKNRELEQEKIKLIKKFTTDWTQTVDIPNDPLTKIILGTVNLNWGTKHIFSQYRHARNSVLKKLGIVYSEIEKKVEANVEEMYSRIDNL